MEQTFVLALAGLTSIGAYLVAVAGFGLRASGLRAAMAKMLECVGMMLGFLLVNLTIGVIAILAVRILTRGFVSLYLANDITLLVISVLQGLAFHWWRESGSVSKTLS